ncbi:hypothetical protein [Methylorubrum extorquens]|uniref:hypothetical protein n=1 Tax=Methylorubrum extorquens TaxID=408 RepID=UPI0005C13D8E|nr:hypothetical protein [Methylorubrum extorquens]MCP1544548.1 hypothetical protein [Methylorubrum extorquens]MCP1588105.1 hypothetical protein [Methylorubrum extorquens]
MRDEETFASKLLALEIVIVTLVDALDEANTMSKDEVSERVRLIADNLCATSKLDLTQKVGTEMGRIADSLRRRVGRRASEI